MYLRFNYGWAMYNIHILIIIVIEKTFVIQCTSQFRYVLSSKIPRVNTPGKQQPEL